MVQGCNNETWGAKSPGLPGECAKNGGVIINSSKDASESIPVITRFQRGFHRRLQGRMGQMQLLKVIIRIALHTSCSHRPFFKTSIYMCARVMLYMYIYTHTGEGKGREGEHIHFVHFFGVCWNGISGLHCRETRPFQGPNERRASCSFGCRVFLFYLLGTLA